MTKRRRFKRRVESQIAGLWKNAIPLRQKSFTYLQLRRPTLISDQEQVAVSVDHDLLLEPAALGTLLLHVGTGQVAVDERRLAGRQRADDTEADVGHAAAQRPLLAVDERVWKGKKKE